MPYWVYILWSQNSRRHYCGQTNSLETRIDEHNDPDYQGTKTTKRFKGPWEIMWTKECETRGEAMILERTIKKRGISRYLLDQGPAGRAGGC